MRPHKLRKKIEESFQIQTKSGGRVAPLVGWSYYFEGGEPINFGTKEPCLRMLTLLKQDKLNKKKIFRVLKVKRVTTVEVIA